MVADQEDCTPEAYYNCKKHGMIRFGCTTTYDGKYEIVIVRDIKSETKNYYYCCPLCVNELLLKEIKSERFEVLDSVNGVTLETSTDRYTIE